VKKVQTSAREAVAQLDTVVSGQLKAGYYLYCAEAGEEVFYTEIDDRLRRLDDDMPVTLVFYTESELLAATLADARGFLGRWLQQLPGIADSFYAGHGSLDALVQLAEALGWLREMSFFLTARGVDLAGWPERLLETTRTLLTAAEQNGAVEVGDFLLYELQGTLEGLHARLARIELAAGEAT
jgi:hypothetical protein